MFHGEVIHGKYISAVYKITNEQNGKVYIGGSSNVRDRRQQHLWNLEHGCHHIKQMQADYDENPNAFRFDVIEYCNPDTLVELERKYISEYDSMNPDYGYNRESGGNKDKTISIETKQIWSEHRKGEGAAMYGKHHTEETKKKMSENRRGIRISDEAIRRMAETKRGKKMSLEARMKMSASRKGRKLSPEHIAAMVAARKGFKHSEESKKKMSLARLGKHMGEENKYHKDVICVETDTIYHGVNEAGRQTGISATHISAACKGKRNVAGGFHWKYADEENTQQNVGSIFDNAVMA